VGGEGEKERGKRQEKKRIRANGHFSNRSRRIYRVPPFKKLIIPRFSGNWYQ